MLGIFHYIPILFHQAERPTRLQKDLLELYGLIIGDLQGKYPGSAVLIHGQGCNLRRFRLKPNSENARQTMQRMREIQIQKMVPALMLNSHCQICEFRQKMSRGGNSEERPKPVGEDDREGNQKIQQQRDLHSHPAVLHVPSAEEEQAI